MCFNVSDFPLYPAWQVHSNAVFDLEWLEREDKILSGSGDQTIVLHDVPTGDKLETFRGHVYSINSISARVGDDGLYFLNSYFFFNKISCYFDDSVLCGLMVFTTSYYLLYFFRKNSECSRVVDFLGTQHGV